MQLKSLPNPSENCSELVNYKLSEEAETDLILIHQGIGANWKNGSMMALQLRSWWFYPMWQGEKQSLFRELS